MMPKPTSTGTPLGVPRLVNALCYRSILHAAANDISIIDSTNIVTDDLFD